MDEKPCTWLAEHPEALSEEVRPAHLETCEQCRQQVEGLERMLRRALAPKEVPVPPELARRIEAAVEARYGRGRRRRFWAWLLAAVVLGLLLLATSRRRVDIADRPAQNQKGLPTHFSRGPADAGELPGEVAPAPSTQP
jgi:predicted anti-sigma-YlaC factor YlaD